GSVAYGIQPINQLLLSYSYLQNTSTNQAEATIYPRVEYHHLVSMEAGYSTPQIDFWVSYLADSPIPDDNLSSNLVVQQVSFSQAISPTLSWKFSRDRKERPSRLS